MLPHTRQMNQLNSRNDHHDDSIINIVSSVIITTGECSVIMIPVVSVCP